MSSFAHIDPNTNIVTQVIAIESAVLEQAGGWWILGEFRPKSEFVETSPTALLGKDIETGEPALRKNFAGIGCIYEKTLDAFIQPKPLESDVVESSVLDLETGTWVVTEKEIPTVVQQIHDWLTKPI